MDFDLRAITKIAREAKRFVTNELHRTGLGSEDYEFIHFVRHHSGCSQNDVADILNVDKSTISRKTRRLTEKGLSKRGKPERQANIAPVRHGKGAGGKTGFDRGRGTILPIHPPAKRIVIKRNDPLPRASRKTLSCLERGTESGLFPYQDQCVTFPFAKRNIPNESQVTSGRKRNSYR